MHILFIRLLVPVFVQRKYERSKDFRLKLSLRQHSSMKVNAQGHMAHMKQVAIGSNPAASHSKQSDYAVQSWAARAKLLFGMWMRSADVQDPSLPLNTAFIFSEGNFQSRGDALFFVYFCWVLMLFHLLWLPLSLCGVLLQQMWVSCLWLLWPSVRTQYEPQGCHDTKAFCIYDEDTQRNPHKKHSFPEVRLLRCRLKFVDFMKRKSLLVE